MERQHLRGNLNILVLGEVVAWLEATTTATNLWALEAEAIGSLPSLCPMSVSWHIRRNHTFIIARGAQGTRGEDVCDHDV